MKTIIAWSGGKDSTATIILAKEHKIKIDYILFSEVMFDKYISCELPEHINFVKNIAIPKFNQWGYETVILHHDKTYMDYFNQVRQRGKNIGKKVGFPMADKCNARNCKVKPIEKFLKELKEDYVQLIGYAIDEPKRLARLDGKNKISLLQQYGFTEQMALEKCKEYNLLSPYYQYSKRGGCFACPNQSIGQLRYLRNNHRVLYDKLLELEKQDNLIGNIWNTQSNTSMKDIEELLRFKEAQMNIFDFIGKEQK